MATQLSKHLKDVIWIRSAILIHKASVEHIFSGQVTFVKGFSCDCISFRKVRDIPSIPSMCKHILWWSIHHHHCWFCLAQCGLLRQTTRMLPVQSDALSVCYRQVDFLFYTPNQHNITIWKNIRRDIEFEIIFIFYPPFTVSTCETYIIRRFPHEMIMKYY